MNTRNEWDEYDSAAEYLAKRGHTGKYGEPFSIPLLSLRAWRLIEEDPEAFAERVSGFAYAIAMEKVAS